MIYEIAEKCEKEVKKIVSNNVSKEVSYEYISLLADFGKAEKFIDLIDEMLVKKDTFSLIVGEDLITHPNAENLAKLCGLIDKCTSCDVVIIPSQTNTLGVSQICTLSGEVSGYSVGYNVKADFELSALGDGNLDMPALNQQEGTFTNIDKKVIPTNAALAFNGYTLNEIANELLNEEVEYTIERHNKIMSVKDNGEVIIFKDFKEYSTWLQNVLKMNLILVNSRNDNFSHAYASAIFAPIYIDQDSSWDGVLYKNTFNDLGQYKSPNFQKDVVAYYLGLADTELKEYQQKKTEIKQQLNYKKISIDEITNVYNGYKEKFDVSENVTSNVSDLENQVNEFINETNKLSMAISKSSAKGELRPFAGPRSGSL